LKLIIQHTLIVFQMKQLSIQSFRYTSLTCEAEDVAGTVDEDSDRLGGALSLCSFNLAAFLFKRLPAFEI